MQADPHDATRARLDRELDAICALGPDMPPQAVAAAAHSGQALDLSDGLALATTTWPRDLGAAAYHGPIGALVQDMSPTTEADPAALLVQLLVMLGSVIGRTAHFCAEADVHYLNLFGVLVGESAKARKGVSGGLARRVFTPIDSEWASGCTASGLSSGEGLLWAVRDPIAKQEPIKESGHVIGYQSVIVDPGIADKRLLVTENELASTLRVLAREGNTLSALIRQAWDGHTLRALTKNSPATATGPHISVIAHVTCNELRRYLDATECANGFGNRFLWVCVRRSKLLPDGGTPVDLTPHIARIRSAVEFARGIGELRRDNAARELWRHEYGRLSTGRPGLLGSMTARAEAQVMRLACLYAVGDLSYVVGLVHLQAALEVWRYCFDSAAHIFGASLGDSTADAILGALRATPSGLTRSELLHRLFKGNKTAAEVTRALAVLHGCVLARAEEDRSGHGRPAERWFAREGYDSNDKSPGDNEGNVVNVVNVVGSEDDSVVIR